jgi:DNA-binding NarL/FixJ family response regulator
MNTTVEEENIKILIVEDEPLIAEDLRFILNSINYKVIGVAQDSLKAMDYISNRRPDIVLLDISIKGHKDGIDIANTLNEEYNIPFIYLTSYADKDTVERAKHTMPYGYIVKPFDEKDLLSSIEMAIYRHAQQNKSDFPLMEELNRELKNALTEREYELLCALAEGMTNQEMANKHFISVNTVKYHLKNLFLKLEVANRSAAITRFYAIHRP